MRAPALGFSSVHLADHPTSVTAWSFRPDIEGLRGVAVLLVIAYHARIWGFSGGYIGVDVFFVLSGYLISGLLLREFEQTNRINFRRFYARRIRRLLPATMVVLFASLLIASFVYSPIEMRRMSATAARVALDTSNIYFAEQSTVYTDASVSTDFLHMWSLAVEEQFYLVWPLIILLAAYVGRRWWTTRKAVVGMMALVLTMSLVYCIVLTGSDQILAFYSSPPRFWEFALGGLAAILPSRWFSNRRVTTAAGFLGLLLLVIVVPTYNDSSVFPGFLALVPVLGTVLALVAGASRETTFVGSLLSQKPLLWFGRHSYSWYLWHWPLLTFAGLFWPDLNVAGRILVMAGALGLSDLTLRLVENPIRYSRSLAGRPLLCIGSAVVVTVVGVGASQATMMRSDRQMRSPAQVEAIAASRDTPSISRRGCMVGFTVATPKRGCTFGDTGSPTSVALFGDSHAGHFFPAVEAIALERRWKIDVYVKASCPSAMLPEGLRLPRQRREYSECGAWQSNALAEIIASKPRYVFISNSHRYVGEDGQKNGAGITAKDWEKGIQATVAMLQSKGIQAIVIADTLEPGFNVPVCISRKAVGHRVPLPDCVFDRSESVNPALRRAEQLAVSNVSGAVLVDLNDAICAAAKCAVRQGRTFIYRDGDHLTAAFSRSLAPTLMRSLP